MFRHSIEHTWENHPGQLELQWEPEQARTNIKSSSQPNEKSVHPESLLRSIKNTNKMFSNKLNKEKAEPTKWYLWK